MVRFFGYRIKTGKDGDDPAGALTPIAGVAAGKVPYSVAVTRWPRLIIHRWFVRELARLQYILKR